MCIYRETGSNTPAGNMPLREFNIALLWIEKAYKKIRTNISAAHSLKQYFQQTLDIGIANVKHAGLFASFLDSINILYNATMELHRSYSKILATHTINYIIMYKLNTSGSFKETGCSLGRTGQDYLPTPLILV